MIFTMTKLYHHGEQIIFMRIDEIYLGKNEYQLHFR